MKAIYMDLRLQLLHGGHSLLLSGIRTKTLDMDYSFASFSFHICITCPLHEHHICWILLLTRHPLKITRRDLRWYAGVVR